MYTKPALDNYTAELFDASLFVQDETIFFFNSQIDSIDKSYEGTWIEAYGLRWRFYGQERKADTSCFPPDCKDMSRHSK